MIPVSLFLSRNSVCVCTISSVFIFCQSRKSSLVSTSSIHTFIYFISKNKLGVCQHIFCARRSKSSFPFSLTFLIEEQNIFFFLFFSRPKRRARRIRLVLSILFYHFLCICCSYCRHPFLLLLLSSRKFRSSSHTLASIDFPLFVVYSLSVG